MREAEIRFTSDGVEITFLDDNKTLFLTWFQFITVSLRHPTLLRQVLPSIWMRFFGQF